MFQFQRINYNTKTLPMVRFTKIVDVISQEETSTHVLEHWIVISELRK